MGLTDSAKEGDAVDVLEQSVVERLCFCNPLLLDRVEIFPRSVVGRVRKQNLRRSQQVRLHFRHLAVCVLDDVTCGVVLFETERHLAGGDGNSRAVRFKFRHGPIELLHAVRFD